MAVVAGVDFGTQSVRVAIVDSERGPIGAGDGRVSGEPRPRAIRTSRRSRTRRTWTRSSSRRGARSADARLDGDDGRGDRARHDRFDCRSGRRRISTPLDDYYLWADHRAKDEAALITEVARREKLAGDRDVRRRLLVGVGIRQAAPLAAAQPGASATRFVTALEHCDMVAAVLCGDHGSGRTCRAPSARWATSGCGTNRSADCRPRSFSTAVDPLLAGVRDKLGGRYRTSDHIAGRLEPTSGRSDSGLRAGIPIPVGAFDAHWDAIGAGIHEGDVVNVVGTSTCIIAIAKHADCVPGVCGVVHGLGASRTMSGVEAGLSAVGDIFEAIARRAGTTRRRALDEASMSIAPARRDCCA